MRYAKLDNMGFVVAIQGGGERPGPEWIDYPEDAPPLSLDRVRKIGEEFVSNSGTWRPQQSYDARRAAAYPSTGEQLDMLWHAMEKGELPKIEPFYSQIKAVKAAHPKTG